MVAAGVNGTTFVLTVENRQFSQRAFSGIALSNALHVAVLMNSFAIFISAHIVLQIDWLVADWAVNSWLVRAFHTTPPFIFPQ